MKIKENIDSALIVSQLNLGLTCKCNLKCIHCQCGDARPVDMSRETMEKIFSEIRVVEFLYLMGGEIMLAEDTLETLIQVLKEKRVSVDDFQIFTNGTLYSEKYFKLLNELSKFCKKKKAGNLLVSFDKFHQSEAKALLTEQVYFENLKRLNQSPLLRDFTSECDVLIVNEGRAKSYRGEIPVVETEQLTSEILFQEYGTTKDGRKIGYVSGLTLDVYGRVVVDQCYDEQDKRSFGTVHSNTLQNIILSAPITIKVTDSNEYNSHVLKKNKVIQNVFLDSHMKRLDIQDIDSVSFFNRNK